MGAKKVCIRCGKVKPLDQFYKKSTYKDGHDSRCITCLKAYFKKIRDDTIEPYEEKALRTNITGRDWEVYAAPTDEYGEPTWELGSRLTPLDVTITLSMGHFDKGMKLINRKTTTIWEVMDADNGQILKSKSKVIKPVKGSFGKISYA